MGGPRCDEGVGALRVLDNDSVRGASEHPRLPPPSQEALMHRQHHPPRPVVQDYFAIPKAQLRPIPPSPDSITARALDAQIAVRLQSLAAIALLNRGLGPRAEEFGRGEGLLAATEAAGIPSLRHALREEARPSGHCGTQGLEHVLLRSCRYPPQRQAAAHALGVDVDCEGLRNGPPSLALPRQPRDGLEGRSLEAHAHTHQQGRRAPPTTKRPCKSPEVLERTPRGQASLAALAPQS
mmetsp:Transcript_82141/g.238158  ORF Transcript_82141/g.238158 Transcript_82141/m.238158 type:complete len:238 (-) Transcript_82141:789-1502(-)